MAANTNTNIDAFAYYIQEDVDYCETTDVLGGLQEAEIYYCYLPYIEVLRLPSAISTNKYAGKIRQEISCKENFGFKKIKALVDTAGLTSRLSSSGKDTSELEGFLIGTRAELIGVSRKFRHRPFVFIVQDRNGRKFVCGTLVSPAYLQSFDLETGKKFDDDNGAAFKVKSNTIIFEYDGEIPVYTAPENGDYDTDYDDDYD